MPLRDAFDILSYTRKLANDKMSLEAIYVRRLAFFGSQWLDHQGRTEVDFYPLPGEGEQREKVTPKQGLQVMSDLQKRLDEKLETNG